MDETFWKKIRFAMIFVLLASLLLLVLVKLIRPIPFIEGSEVMKDIQTSEKILKEQKEYTHRVRILCDTIKGIDFQVNQQQRLEEIKREIQSLEDVYKENKQSYVNSISKNIWKTIAVLRIYFEARESFNKIQTNNKKLKSNLDECKANI